MKKNILKLVLFSGAFAFFAISNYTEAEAQVNSCPGLSLHCMQIGDVNYVGRLKIKPRTLTQSIE